VMVAASAPVMVAASEPEPESEFNLEVQRPQPLVILPRMSSLCSKPR
jgi:hypothetical protein